MSKRKGISAFWNKPIPSAPVVLPSVRFNPGWIFSLASSVRDSPSQRATIEADIGDIFTANGFRPDVCVNWGWDDAEPTLGNWDFSKAEIARVMASNAGCKWWVKIFFRTYSAGGHVVPPYMQSTAGSAYAGTYGGTGTSANGEYFAADGSCNAKFMVPAVADRFEAFLKEIGRVYNNDTSFAGVIINETSLLGALTSSTGMTVNPGTHVATYTEYFNNLFNAVINARDSLNNCELVISPNNPQEVFTQSPVNATTLFENNQVGFYIQDAYKVPPTKFSVTNIYAKTQVYKTQVSGMYNLSGEVSSHKADSATNTPGYSIADTVDYAITTNGATHMVFQVNATSGTSTNAIRYQDEVALMKVTLLRPRSIRPANYT